MEHLPLHVLRVDKVATAINRAHIFFHSFLVSLFLYHRLKSLFFTPNDVVSSTHHLPLLPSLLLFLAELILTFIWLSDQASRWKLVDRTVFIERLPENSKLPAIDVFICTADPDKEPTFEVMNTVISAMALDYPSDKLHVYLSDDGGSALTLDAMKEAWCFATWWVPFCKRYSIECSCPMAYFDDDTSPTVNTSSSDFVKERLILKEKYELFKKRVEINVLHHRRRETNKNNRTNHPPLVQVINEDCMDPTTMNLDCNHDIPLLVYVAREKRPSYPHHFKAGALNVLQPSPSTGCLLNTEQAYPVGASLPRPFSSSIRSFNQGHYSSALGLGPIAQPLSIASDKIDSPLPPFFRTRELLHIHLCCPLLLNALELVSQSFCYQQEMHWINTI